MLKLSVGYLQDLLKHFSYFDYLRKLEHEVSDQRKSFGLEKGIHDSSINIPLIMKIWGEVLRSSSLEYWEARFTVMWEKQD